MTQCTKIFLHATPWDMRSRNTDWRMMRFDMPRLAGFQPSLEFLLARSPRMTLATNFKAVFAAAARRFGRTPDPAWLLTDRLSARELRRSNAQLIFAHETFPLNAAKVPVIWWQAVLDPQMQLSWNATPQDVEREIELKRPLFARCARVMVSTEAEARRHEATFPESGGCFVAMPFFTPQAKACEPEVLEKHHNPATVRILFVGNHAYRKGLDQLFAAFLALPQPVQRRAMLTVISSFDRSNIDVPQHERIQILRGLRGSEVMAEMRHSHIFVNAARFESYGVVFHEAMSQGLACIAPNWEVQRELFDDGRAGILADCNAEQLRIALERLIIEEELRHSLALAAWQRFAQRYAPEIVAAKFATLFHEVGATTKS